MAVVVAQLVTSVPGVGQWTSSPLEAFADGLGVGLLVLGLGLALLTTVSVRVMGGMASPHLRGFAAVFGLAILAYTLSQQTVVRAAGFGYAFWALGLGLAIANTVGTPVWVKPALRSELYIKTGLVLLGAEILFGNILSLGVPGLFVAWVVTPTVLIFMYQFGTRVLRIQSRALVIVIAAATSVCGVSAAIAAAARAKKEELTLAVGMSLIFTVVMMVVMPLVVRGVGRFLMVHRQVSALPDTELGWSRNWLRRTFDNPFQLATDVTGRLPTAVWILRPCERSSVSKSEDHRRRIIGA